MPDAVRTRHVAIIADGNRRGARERGLPILAGHVQGIEAMRRSSAARVTTASRRSASTFSTENWSRPDAEVSGLFGLIDGAVRQYTDELIAEGVRVRVIGRLHQAPPDVQRSIRAAEERTSKGARMTLNICFNYSGRAEIVDAARALLAAHADPNGIDEAHFADHLYTAGQAEVDLLIRTGGDQRTSNFLNWQAAYAELVFCAKYWPTSLPTTSTRRSPSSSIASDGSEAELMLVTRLITAAILAPLVLAVVVLGEPWRSLLVGVAAFLAFVELVAGSRCRRVPAAAGPHGSWQGWRWWPLASSPRTPRASAASAGLMSAVDPPGLPWRPRFDRRGPAAGDRVVHPRRPPGRLRHLGDELVRRRLRRPPAAALVLVAHLAPAGGSVDDAGRDLRPRLGRGMGPDVLILVVWGYDTGAYLTGRLIGRTRLIENISPAKTVEGVAGGLVLATVGAGVGAALIGLEPWHPLIIGPFVGPSRPGRRSGRVDAQASRRPQGVGLPGPGTWRHPRPDRLVPLRRARDGRLRPAGRRTGRVTAGVAVLGSTGSIGRQAIEVIEGSAIG